MSENSHANDTALVSDTACHAYGRYSGGHEYTYEHE